MEVNKFKSKTMAHILKIEEIEGFEQNCVIACSTKESKRLDVNIKLYKNHISACFTITQKRSSSYNFKHQTKDLKTAIDIYNSIL